MFLCDSLAKRLLKSPLAQRQRRSETRPVAAPHTTEGGGSLLGWPRAVGNSTTLWDLGELAPEQLPWDVSSRKPSRMRFPFHPDEDVLRAPPRVPRAPVLPSQSAVPSSVAASLHLRDKACAFLLCMPPLLLQSGDTQGVGSWPNHPQCP